MIETEVSSSTSVQTAISVTGMDCASCVAHVEKAAQSVDGVEACQVNLARGRASVRFDPNRTSPAKIAAAITESGYPAAPELSGAAAKNLEEDRLARQTAASRFWFRRAVIGLLLWLPVELAHWLAQVAGLSTGSHMAMEWIAFATSTIAIIYVGWGFYRGAWRALRRFTSNMDTLIAMGASVAYGYSLVAFFGHLAGWWPMPKALYFMESSGLLALISLGHWLEARARDSAGSAIRQLLNLAPSVALRLDESDVPHEVPAADVHVGDRLLVRPGDLIPVDGVVLAGRSAVDEAMISGEPLPITKNPGDSVIGGTLNAEGRLTIRATKVGSETALAQIVQIVETAQSAKPPVQQLADRIAAVFVPTVLIIAAITALAWYGIGQAHHWETSATWAIIANAVCSVLIIACPCALGLALPAALMVGTGRGAKRGILIRDVDALQNAGSIEIVVLDKTGTITLGRPTVADVVPLNGHTRQEILRLAAAAEQFSGHPLAKALVAKAREENISLPNPDGFTTEAGLGVIAQVEGQTLLVGNDALLGQHGSIGPNGDSPNGTVVHIATKSSAGAAQRMGYITFVDPIKPESAAAIAQMHRMNLRTVLLTGDNRAAAEAVAKAVGITQVYAQVRPGEKAQIIRSLQNPLGQSKRTNVAMVGDGINDAPALATADLGIAIGSGSDVAKEAGDILLVGGNLRGVVSAIHLSRATMRTIRQNLFLAFIYNVLAIPLAGMGLLNPLIAAAAMALSDVTVIGNALRLYRAKIDP